MHFQLPLKGEYIACELITLQVQYGIFPGKLLAAMHDRASTNNVPMVTVKVIYPECLDVGITHPRPSRGNIFNTNP